MVSFGLRPPAVGDKPVEPVAIDMGDVQVFQLGRVGNPEEKVGDALVASVLTAKVEKAPRTAQIAEIIRVSAPLDAGLEAVSSP